ncbi:hypothetical protein GUJ93_ZPchr0004g40140 [Zizania palustris]|uniref:Uncharacterized protein n=1 Tax=Zizania palustris TaxID=103762 RepID=A0A8J5SLM7_ZIZPA|nr:hypothetical protein GUJ93_ZPchr0004g40140 [Zizania palustris]
MLRSTFLQELKMSSVSEMLLCGSRKNGNVRWTLYRLLSQNRPGQQGAQKDGHPAIMIVVAKNIALEMWTTIQTVHIGADLVDEAKIQTLR